MTNERLLEDSTFVVVDVETTGMNPIEDRITEIAMMKVTGGNITDEYSTLINPLITIPAFITDLTGINNLMVADAPPAREVVPSMAEFLGDAVFTAHNASFDWMFVSQTARRERLLELSNDRLCTVKMTRRILPFLPSKSLGPVARFLDVPIPQRHGASGDAYATAQILIRYLAYLQRKFAIRSVEEVLRFQTVPLAAVGIPAPL
ncbi:MAG: 3'-5' exonuclease [Ignavibacteriales bacterium]|nr:3'-5' exonuclease [Ignavibacteriales bacterium]